MPFLKATMRKFTPNHIETRSRPVLMSSFPRTDCKYKMKRARRNAFTTQPNSSFHPFPRASSYSFHAPHCSSRSLRMNPGRIHSHNFRPFSAINLLGAVRSTALNPPYVVRNLQQRSLLLYTPVSRCVLILLMKIQFQLFRFYLYLSFILILWIFIIIICLTSF